MLRSYVCQQCRLQRPRRLALPQLHPRATVVSFRRTPSAAQPTADPQHHDDANPGRGGQPQEHAPRPGHPGPDQDAPVWRIRGGPSQGEGTRAPGRYSAAAQHAAAPGHFPQRQHREDKPASGPGPGSSSSSSSSSGPGSGSSRTSVAQTINGLVSSNQVEAAWALFGKTFTSRDVPALTDPPLSDISLLSGGKLFERLARGIGMEFAQGNDKVPTPTQVLFQYAQLDIEPPRIWTQTIAHMTYHFLRSMAPPGQRGGLASETTTDRGTDALMAELLSIWRLFFQRHGTQQGRDPLASISTEWKSIPDGPLSFGAAGRYFGARLQHFHSTHASGPELQHSAIVIFNYFHGETQPPHVFSETLLQQNKPFLRLLTSTLAGSTIVSAFKHVEVNPQILSLGDEYRRSIAAQMDLAPGIAASINGIDPSATPEERSSHLRESFLKRIGRQVMMQANVREVEKIWTEVEYAYKTPEGKSQIPPSIYNAFLSGFMTLFRPEHTVKVWNHMMAHGVSPDLETWNAMLMGCAKAKDLAGMNTVWDRMLRSGIEPDQRCWTTRVHSTIGTHSQIEAGLAILDEMGKRWLSAEKAIQNVTLSKHTAKAKGAKKVSSDANVVNNFTKPAIGVINGAVDGIAQSPTKGSALRRSKGLTFEQKVSYVQKILQWAGNFGIKPDTRTYNALIKLYLGGNDFPTAFKLLRQMEKEGLEGDLATHTMLLRAAFDNQRFDTFSHQEQADRILGLFDNLEQGGLKPNTYVYQIAVDRLLKNFSNYTGVRAVIERMMNRGFAVSPQIYTSLVTHYFQQDPPAIREIDSLVERILGPPAASTDRFLFDRIIEGYARVGEIASMMTMLTKMSAHGKRPSFVALTEVVRALYNDGDWDRARDIVQDVQQGRGVAKDGPSVIHTKDRDQFFYAVQALSPDLLEELAGDHFKAPVRAPSGRAAQMMQGAPGNEQVQPLYEQQQHEQQQQQQQYQYQPQQQQHEQQSYDQYQQQQQQYDQGGYEQVPYEQGPYDQAQYDQTPYEQAPSQHQPYDPAAYEQAQMAYQQEPNGQTPGQQTQDLAGEYVNAQHAGYLSNEPDAPRQQWSMDGNRAAGRR